MVYGTVVSTFLRNPGEIGPPTPAPAGSYALIGVLVGTLPAGAVGDVIGRRKVMPVVLLLVPRHRRDPGVRSRPIPAEAGGSGLG